MNKLSPTLSTNVSDIATSGDGREGGISFRSVLERHLPIASRLMLIFIALYLSELGIFPLSIDEEFAAFRDDPAVWVAQGRWAVYLIELFLLPQPTIPYLPVVLFGVCTVVSYLLILRSLRFETNLWAYILFPLFAAFPIWFFIIEFYTNLPGIGLGLLSTGLTLYYYDRLISSSDCKLSSIFGQLNSLIIAIVATAFALACYQSFLFFIISAGLGAILVKLPGHNRIWRLVWQGSAIMAIVIVGGGVLYYLIWMALLYGLGVPISYIQGFADLGSFLENPVRILNTSLAELWKIYSGSPAVYGHRNLVGVLILAGLLAILVQLSSRGLAAVGAGIILIVAILTAPFALHPLSRGFAAYRSMVAVPYIVFLCGTLVLTSRIHLMRVIGIAAVILVIFGSLYSLSLFQAANHLVRDHDRLVAQQVYTRIAAAHDKFDVNKPYLVDFYGGKKFQTPYPRVLSSTIGQSFFEWDQGNPYRIISFMNLIGFSNLKPLAADQRANYLAEFNTMAIWPNEGSVKVIGDVTLVRLSQEPGLVHQNLVVPFRFEGDDVLYRLRDQQSSAPPVLQPGMKVSSNGSIRIPSQPDPQVVVPLKDAGARTCRVLQVAVTQQVKVGAAVQVFYRPTGAADFSEKNSFSIYQPPGAKETTFLLESDTGFEPVLRVDPVQNRQAVRLNDIAVGCARRL
ncbi:glucosyltransferase domain-containing protein [Microvirga terrae]|uniref:Glucosyltransferase domain-containing protein n=1 Tax=Microvirga terrae TaxID=2740529 RepID=A0ABY5RNA3_9HYPH|nr:glucosyltransferase domain-containing protein [Microvirga terrae]UVF18359.1 glucosyltransferase domain-containing protein [Microvirga terrae]